MRKYRAELCGLPEIRLLRRAGAAQELRRVALVCPDQVAKGLMRASKEEHRQAAQVDRDLIQDVKDRGGVCFPSGMSREEWRSRLPVALHGMKGRCVPADEIAQEFADRGTIPEPSSDAVLDRLGAAYARARAKFPNPDPGELRREARRLVRQRVGRALRQLLREVQCERTAPKKRSEA
jgi:hypothetical protein